MHINGGSRTNYPLVGPSRVLSALSRSYSHSHMFPFWPQHNVLAIHTTRFFLTYLPTYLHTSFAFWIPPSPFASLLGCNGIPAGCAPLPFMYCTSFTTFPFELQWIYLFLCAISIPSRTSINGLRLGPLESKNDTVRYIPRLHYSQLIRLVDPKGLDVGY